MGGVESTGRGQTTRLHYLRSNVDVGQSIVRLIIAAVIMVYLLRAGAFRAGGEFSATESFWFLMSYCTYAIAMLVSTILYPSPIFWRRVFGVLVDLGSTGFGLCVTGQIGAPLAVLSLWVPVGNGVRFGREPMFLAMVCSMLALLAAGIYSPFWRENLPMLSGFAICGLVLPIYVHGFLRREGALKKEALRANAAKADALRKISHELMTPASSIVGLGQLMQGSQNPRERARSAALILGAGEHLASLAEELVELAAIENMDVKPTENPFRLHELVLSAAELLQPRADAKEIRIGCLFDVGVPTHFFGDERRISQVVLNLVSNAIKFTDANQVLILVGWQAKDARTCVVCIDVVDFGPGIAAAEQSSIFEAFFQGASSTRSDVSGLGLGTTISKELAELLGGTISLSSEIGKGSTFSVSLPLHRDQLRHDGQGVHGNAAFLYGEPSTASNSVLGRRFNVVALGVGPLCANLELELGVFHLADTDEMSIEMLTATLEGGGPVWARWKIVIVGDGAGSMDESTKARLAAVGINLIVDPSQFALALTRIPRPGGLQLANSKRLERVPSAIDVLVGEDDEIGQMYFQEMFRTESHRLVIASDGEELLNLLMFGIADIAFVDVQLPRMTGLEAVRTYKESLAANESGTPIVMMSANGTGGLADFCVDAGARAFFEKPITREQLNAAIGTFVDTTSPPSPHR
jgi:signal transduction histidine kinase/CheY-like chemotaxis protein